MDFLKKNIFQILLLISLITIIFQLNKLSGDIHLVNKQLNSLENSVNWGTTSTGQSIDKLCEILNPKDSLLAC